LKPEISIIIPIFGHNLELNNLHNRLKKCLNEITNDYDIILVNDESPDNSWEVICKLAENDKRVKGVNLSRNFGQHRAIAAGIKYAAGQWCVIMDCDLQDRPEEIIKLYNKANEGYDIVMARRGNRKDNFIKRFTSKFFYLIFNFLTNQKLDNRFTSFGIYSNRVINIFKNFKEKDRSTGLLFNLIGFNKSHVDVQHDSRDYGESSYTIHSRYVMAKDHILSYSTKPLELALGLGFFVTLASIVYAIYLIGRYFFQSATVPGWYSLIVSIFFFSGIIIMLVGMVGLYVGKIHNEVKGRPLFIVESTTF